MLNTTFSDALPDIGGKRRIDTLIIGQGICGTLLSYYLIKAGKKVVVIDDGRRFTASKVASGVINPVTGRRIVRSWMIEELLPFARKEYQAIGKLIGAPVLKECTILDFHPSHQMKEAFDKRLGEETDFLHISNELKWKDRFNFHFGVGEINPCLLIDLNTLIARWRDLLQQQQMLETDTFEVTDLTLDEACIGYKNLTANTIVFCEGVNAANNPFFRNLPHSPNKGEAIIARITGLDVNHIYKQGISIVPWKDDLFWIGSSYEWNFEDDLPTIAFKNKIEVFLRYFLKMPFEIVDHFASVRPANLERRPFVGLHPKFKNIGILNGMGTKGCSLAPFFAKQLADLLIEGRAILPEADVRRFEKILARKMN